MESIVKKCKLTDYEKKKLMNKLIFILFVLLVSCAPKKNFSLNDLEEIYNFKAISVAFLKNEKKERVIADFIAGMTDRYAINLHKKIK